MAGRERVGDGRVVSSNPLGFPRFVKLFFIATWVVNRREVTGYLLPVRAVASGCIKPAHMQIELATGALQPCGCPLVFERKPNL